MTDGPRAQARTCELTVSLALKWSDPKLVMESEEKGRRLVGSLYTELTWMPRPVSPTCDGHFDVGSLRLLDPATGRLGLSTFTKFKDFPIHPMPDGTVEVQLQIFTAGCRDDTVRLALPRDAGGAVKLSVWRQDPRQHIGRVPEEYYLDLAQSSLRDVRRTFSRGSMRTLAPVEGAAGPVELRQPMAAEKHLQGGPHPGSG